MITSAKHSRNHEEHSAVCPGLKEGRRGITSAKHSGIHEEHSAVCPGPKESRTVLDTLAIMRLEIHPLD